MASAVSNNRVNEVSTAGSKPSLMRAEHVGQEKTSRRRHPQAAGLDRDPDARAVRRAAQPRRQADDAGADSPRRSAPPTCWCRPSPTGSTRSCSSRPDCKLRLIANFGNGVDHIDVDAAHARGITVTNTPGVLTEDTADMTMALILAVPRRLVEGASILHRRQELGRAGRRPGCSATASAASGSASSAWAASARRWRAAPRAFGLQIHYHNRRRVAPDDRRGAGRDLLGKPRPDAGAHGHHLGQLPAHAGDLSSAVGAAAEADAAGRLSSSTPRAARSSTRTR